jgi:hypothetical protein
MLFFKDFVAWLIIRYPAATSHVFCHVSWLAKPPIKQCFFSPVLVFCSLTVSICSQIRCNSYPLVHLAHLPLPRQLFKTILQYLSIKLKIFKTLEAAKCWEFSFIVSLMFGEFFKIHYYWVL